MKCFMIFFIHDQKLNSEFSQAEVLMVLLKTIYICFLGCYSCIHAIPSRICHFHCENYGEVIPLLKAQVIFNGFLHCDKS